MAMQVPYSGPGQSLSRQHFLMQLHNDYEHIYENVRLHLGG